MTWRTILALAAPLILAGCGPNIHDAAAFGQMDTVKGLLAQDPSLLDQKNTRGKTPIFFAITSDRQPIVAYLIEQGADLTAEDVTGLTPLHIAVWMGRPKIVDMILEAGVPVDIKDKFGDTPMHVAAHSRFAGSADRRIEMAERLIEAGATVDVKNSDGKTPLDLANEAFREAGIEAFEALESEYVKEAKES